MLVVKKSEQIRQLVSKRYVKPALQSGKRELTIRAGDVLRDWEAEGLPRARTTMICQVLRGSKLLEEHGLRIEGIDGPKSQESRNTVIHYHALEARTEPMEDSAAWAERVTSQAFGYLREEITAFGGAEAFMSFLRDGEEVSR